MLASLNGKGLLLSGNQSAQKQQQTMQNLHNSPKFPVHMDQDRAMVLTTMSFRATLTHIAFICLAACTIGEVNVTDGDDGMDESSTSTSSSAESTSSGSTSTTESNDSTTSSTTAVDSTTEQQWTSTFFPETSTGDESTTDEPRPGPCMPCDFDGNCLPGETCWCPSALGQGICLPDEWTEQAPTACDVPCVFMHGTWECKLPGCG